jgi:hypothetical protein
MKQYVAYAKRGRLKLYLYLRSIHVSHNSLETFETAVPKFVVQFLQQYPTLTTMSAFKIAIVLGVVVALCAVFDTQMHKYYVFEPKDLQQIAQKAIKLQQSKNLTTEQMFTSLIEDLAKYVSNLFV